MLIFGSAVFILTGLVFIFAQDFLWAWHLRHMESQGIDKHTLKRNKAWERGNILRGLIFLSIGIITLIFSILEYFHLI